MHNTFIADLFREWNLPAKPSKQVAFINRILNKLGVSVRLAPLWRTGLMSSIEQRMNMFHLASQVLVYKVPGDFVELGCHAGQLAAMFQKIIDHYDNTRRLHVYDSFEGLPEINDQDGDTPFYQGQLATTQEALMQTFQSLDLMPPVVHAGWFEDTLPTSLPESIAFAHLDGDVYSSIKTSLHYVYPRLSKGAICLIDDYADSSVWDGWNLLPGVKRACDEFLNDKPESLSVLYAGNQAHGFFRKL